MIPKVPGVPWLELLSLELEELAVPLVAKNGDAVRPFVGVVLKPYDLHDLSVVVQKHALRRDGVVDVDLRLPEPSLFALELVERAAVVPLLHPVDLAALRRTWILCRGGCSGRGVQWMEVVLYVKTAYNRM